MAIPRPLATVPYLAQHEDSSILARGGGMRGRGVRCLPAG
jgi:hypothetical protein